MKHSGKIVINLHTHLPYVLHHGDWPHGSDWLCEAVAECYLPLLTMCHELIADGITPNLSLDISPILCEQLEHPDFAPIFIEYCNTKMALALKDAEKFIAMKADPHQVCLAHYWHEWYLRRQYEFEHSYNYSIIESFKKLQRHVLPKLLSNLLTQSRVTKKSLLSQRLLEMLKKHLKLANLLQLARCG